MNFVRFVPEFHVQSGWASILGTIGGAVLAPFTGGASLAIGSAAGQAADAAMAENKAADQQTAAADKSAAAYAPYANAGQSAITTLSGLMGLGGGGGPMTAPAATPVPFRSSQGKEIVGNAVPRPTEAPAPMAGMTLRDALRPPQSSYAAKVRMIAPDGSQEDVDEADVPLFERDGARRVS